MSRIVNNYVGQRFGRLVVRAKSGSDSHRNTIWECECDCGAVIVVAGYNLRTGHTKSCGCLKLEGLLSRSVTHGYATSTRKTEYNSWRSAKGRCFNKQKNQYEDYGGRGICMCQRWAESFEAFLEDLGDKPTPQHTIDRIDNDGHYSCGQCEECRDNGWTMNCRWATRKEQSNNRRKRRKCREAICVT